MLLGWKCRFLSSELSQFSQLSSKELIGMAPPIDEELEQLERKALHPHISGMNLSSLRGLFQGAPAGCSQTSCPAAVGNGPSWASETGTLVRESCSAGHVLSRSFKRDILC